MKSFVLFLLFLGIGGYIVYAVPSFHVWAANLLTYSECDKPLPYRLGHIDPKFKLSTQDVYQDIQSATGIWSTAEGKNLFVYSPSAKLTISLVYDERQALDSSITQLNSQLSQKNFSLQQEIDQYQKDEADFQERLNAFNALVTQYNRQGSITEAQYQNLVQQQNELQKEGNALNEKAKQLNLATNDYNYNVYTLNNDIHQYQNVLAQKPEEGLYNGANDTISIYFAENKQELIHTLTHELGHALGMEHVQNPNAIMYPYTNNATTVTPDDKSQLAYVCRKQSALFHDAQEFDLWLYAQFHKFFTN